MKRVIISAVLLLGVFALVIGGYFYLISSASEIIGKAELVSANYKNGDYEKALSMAKETERLWISFSNNHIFWVENGYITEISLLVAKVAVLAQARDDDLTEECYTLVSALKAFHNSQITNFNNIF